MHTLEPYYSWQHLYTPETDELSYFYKNRSEDDIYYKNTIYNHYIHPYWDDIGSPTLYIKVLFADYKNRFSVIELFGEWNDCINNDIMFLKRTIIESMMKENINKFILIGENILNFHYSDDCYYSDWFEEIEDGWIAAVNFRMHVRLEFEAINLDSYIAFGGELDDLNWRTFLPVKLFEKVNSLITKRLKI